MLLFLRHGSTDYNTAGQERVRGQLNIPLSRHGKQEAADAATRLKALQDSGTAITRILACDLDRAQQTANPVGKALGLPVHYTPALRTWDLGELEGKPIDAHVQHAISTMVKNPTKIPAGGESYQQFLARYLSFLGPFYNGKPNDVSVIVTHGQNIRAAHAWTAAGGRGLTVDPTIAADGDTTAEHAGLAVAQPPATFEYIDPKPSQRGAS